MSTTELGKAFDGQVSPMSGLQQMVDAITREVLTKVQAQLKAPTVSVAAPNVSVAAPNVTVAAPKAPPAPAPPKVVVEPYIDVQVPGLDGLRASVEGLRNDIRSLLSAMSRPCVRSVERDSKGLITQITETR